MYNVKTYNPFYVPKIQTKNQTRHVQTKHISSTLPTSATSPLPFPPSSPCPLLHNTTCKSKITPILSMSQEQEPESQPQTLIIGNPCHDIIPPTPTTLGGAVSYLSNILSPLSPSPSLFISKAGPDFSFSLPHILSPSPTTLFHAIFHNSNRTRTLRRIRTCDPIHPSDLPAPPRHFRFGIAAGVAGEIIPSTLARMIGLCDLVFADAQSLIRVFDGDGRVGMVPLRESGFWGMVGGIGFLKCSEEERGFVEVEEVRRVCCVVVTEGRAGCRVFWGEGEVRVGGFGAEEVDATGAGDSFLGGFVAGIGWGLSVPDAALLGNFFGALTVGQVGVPTFGVRLMEVMCAS